MTSTSTAQLARVRTICSSLPGTEERLSHGEPTFFAGGKVFVMFANDHHGDGHIAIWVPAPPGLQAALIEKSPSIYFKPPYVGVRGWVGIELPEIATAELRLHVEMAWEMVAPRKLRLEYEADSMRRKREPHSTDPDKAST